MEEDWEEYTEAEQACIDIYNDYTREEIENAPTPSSIYNAWFVGKRVLRNAE